MEGETLPVPIKSVSKFLDKEQCDHLTSSTNTFNPLLPQHTLTLSIHLEQHTGTVHQAMFPTSPPSSSSARRHSTSSILTVSHSQTPTTTAVRSSAPLSLLQSASRRQVRLDARRQEIENQLSSSSGASPLVASAISENLLQSVLKDREVTRACMKR